MIKVFILDLAVVIILLLWFTGGTVHASHEQNQQSPVNLSSGVWTVCPAGPPVCDYAVIQDAVDAAADGDLIKIAQGVYSDLNTHGILVQVVYLNKPVTIRGGYTTEFDLYDPVAHPTTLDAQGQGRVFFITDNVAPTIEGLRITGGDAAGLGGGLSNKDAGGGVYVINSQPVISQSWVFDNQAQSGGGVFLWHSDATLDGNSVISNSAQFYGGGLCLRNSDALLTGNTVTANTANDGGGLFLYDSAATLDGNVVEANSAASYGGGLYLGSSDAWLQENVITGNVADYSGGLYLYTSDATLNGNIISANSATHHGGGLYLYNSDATLDGNTIVANTAGFYGGGLYLYSRSDAEFVNNVVADNEAAELGSGLYVKASDPSLLHTTIANNGSARPSSQAQAEGLTASADGRGIYVTNSGPQESNVVLTNTILVSHSIGVEVVEGNKVGLGSTLWGNEADWAGAGEILTGTVNWWGDPAFVEPGAGDYHITTGSAARDGGLDAAVSADMDGQPRPFGAGYDVGADELTLKFNIAQQANPDPVQAGAQLTYTLRVTNSSDVDLHLAISDILPAQVYPTGILTWTPGLLAPGAAWVEQVVVTTAQDYAGPLLNVVQVAAGDGTTDLDAMTVVAVAPPNQAPRAPQPVAPADGAGDVPLDQTLRWQGGDPDGDPVSYTVALGYTNPPPIVATGVLTTHYDAGALAPGSDYYWAITATDGLSYSVGQVWRFGTVVPLHNQAPHTPQPVAPADGAGDVPLDQTLRWQGGDPDGDPVRYTVAVGHTNPPPVVATGVLTTHYDAGALAPGSDYYWAITATDGLSVSVGPVWHFSTEEAEPLQPQLAVSQQASPNPVQAGARLTYTLRVTNSGEVDLHMTISDVLPAQVAPTGLLTWRPGVIAPGEVWVQQVVVTAAQDYAGTLLNRVEAAAEQGATGVSTGSVVVVQGLVTMGPLQAGQLVATGAGCGTVVVQAPAGAVPEYTQLALTFTPTVNGSPPGLTFCGCAFKLEAYRQGVLLPNLVLDLPLEATLNYSQAAVSGVNAGTLELFYWDGEAWSTGRITLLERDTSGQSLTARLEHLGEFAMFASAEHSLYLPLVMSQP
jgi:hypothetical protein